jgi:hypothetical protein
MLVILIGVGVVAIGALVSGRANVGWIDAFGALVTVVGGLIAGLRNTVSDRLSLE